MNFFNFHAPTWLPTQICLEKPSTPFSSPQDALCNNPVSSDEILKALRSLSINTQIIVLSNASRENVCTSDLYISVTSSSDELLTFSFLLAPLQLFNWTCIFPSHTFSPSFAFPFPFSSSFFLPQGEGEHFSLDFTALLSLYFPHIFNSHQLILPALRPEKQLPPPSCCLKAFPLVCFLDSDLTLSARTSSLALLLLVFASVTNL